MMLHSRQRFGATAVASLGGVRNTTKHTTNKNTVNPAKRTSLPKKSHEKFSRNHDIRNSLLDTKTGSKKDNNDHTATTTASSTSSTADGPPSTALAPSTPSTPSTPATSTSNTQLFNADYKPSDDDIVIHVCDESRKVNRDFKCSKKLLLKEMKYFESYLSASNQYDDIDISVHCDVYIFEWLMRFINNPQAPPELKCKSAVSILISSDFLRMKRLVDNCLTFVHQHINQVIKLPIDLNCINNNLVGKLAVLFSVQDLEHIEDRRNKLKGKLWMKHVEVLLENKKNVLQCCSECGKIYCKSFGKLLKCKKSRPYIDFHGNVISYHTPSTAWKMKNYVQNMRNSKKMEWRSLYWKLWGMFHLMKCKLTRWRGAGVVVVCFVPHCLAETEELPFFFDCVLFLDSGTTCNEYFPSCEYSHCVYHPKDAIFETGSNRGEHSCCGQSALRFDTTMRKTGCCAKNHTPEHVVDLENGGSGGGGGGGSGSGCGSAGNRETKDASGTSQEGTDASSSNNKPSVVTPSVVNTLIRHLELIAVPFSNEAASGGYEEDRIAGLVNGDKSALLEGNGKAEATTKSKDESKKSKDTYGHPRRPSKHGRPSTANSSGRRRSSNNQSSNDSSSRPSTAGRYGSSNSGNGSGSGGGGGNGRDMLQPTTVQPHNDTYRGGIVGYSSTSRRGSSIIAGRSVGTPEAFRANPQRRRMWKLDLQREKDVVRMNALVNKLDTLRSDDDQNLEGVHKFMGSF
jgi:hypothetical protein